MMACPEIKESLSALLDGEETDPVRRSVIEGHLDGCSGCQEYRRELESAREALQLHFGGVLASAPDPGLFFSSLFSSRRSRKGFSPMPRLIASAAVAACLITAFTLLPRSVVELSAAEALRRATDRYLELEDVELWVIPDSEALDLLAVLFKDAKKREKLQEIKQMRVLIQAPHRMLVQPTRNLAGPWTNAERLFGFTGETLWDYKPGGRLVEIASGDLDFALDESLELGDPGLLRFLSWGFLSELFTGEQDLDVDEITGPSDRRAQRRVFEVDLRRNRGKKDREVFHLRGRITIDPRRDFIEKMVLDVNLGGLSLLTVTLEVARVNQGIRPAFFDYSSHMPAGTTVSESSTIRIEGHPQEK